MVSRRLFPAIICVLAVAVGFSSSHVNARSALAPGAQQDMTGIWVGVFTDVQADRGHAVFRDHCAACHEDAAGEAPKLDDAAFMRHWEGHSLDRLYTKIRTTMPAGEVDSVTPAQKIDVLTYILRNNGFPAGEELLKDDAALAGIQIVPLGGLGPLPTGAVAQVVGCLTEVAGNSAVLTNSTEPAPATLDPQTPAYRMDSGSKPGAF